MFLLRDRDAGLAIDQQPIGDNETGPSGSNGKPIYLRVQTGCLRTDPADTLGNGPASLDVCPHPFAFDTEPERAGLPVDAAGAAGKPAVDIIFSGVRNCGIDVVRPFLVAEPITALRTDIST